MMLMMLVPLASIISIIGVPFLLLPGEVGLARVAQAEPCKMCMLHGFGLRFAHMSSTFVAPKLVQCVKRGCYYAIVG